MTTTKMEREVATIDQMPPCPRNVRAASHLRYPGYVVYSDGRVFSCRSQKFLKRIMFDKYPGHSLGRAARVYVHRLVTETFHGVPASGQEVRHLDGRKENCSDENLVWGTRSENMRDKERHGTAPQGERHPRAKLDTIKVKCIRKFHAFGVPVWLVLKHYKISRMQHWRIVNYKGWEQVS